MLGADSSVAADAGAMGSKKVSIIVPCYNSTKYIKECFSSIKNQTLGIENIQVVFINDASTDHTLEYLRKYAEEYPESVEVIDLKENHRQGGARNRGLAHAEGEYILFLDSDDWLDVSMCEKTYQKAAQYDVDILQFPFVHVYGENRSSKDGSYRYGFLDGSLPEIRKGMLLGTFFNFGSQNKLYRRNFLEQQKAAFPEGVVYEEPFFLYPLLFEAQRFYSMEEGLYYYRQTEPSVTVQHMGKKNTLYDHLFVQLELLKKLAANREYIEKYYSEMEFHFLYSYYMETLYFAGSGGKYLGIDRFHDMQRTVLELFPAYEENPYLRLEEFVKLRNVLLSLAQNFTQMELDEYCRKIVLMIDSH